MRPRERLRQGVCAACFDQGANVVAVAAGVAFDFIVEGRLLGLNQFFLENRGATLEQALRFARQSDPRQLGLFAEGQQRLPIAAAGGEESLLERAGCQASITAFDLYLCRPGGNFGTIVAKAASASSRKFAFPAANSVRAKPNSTACGGGALSANSRLTRLSPRGASPSGAWMSRSVWRVLISVWSAAPVCYRGRRGSAGTPSSFVPVVGRRRRQ